MVIQQLKFLKKFRFRPEIGSVYGLAYGDFLIRVEKVHDQWKPSIQAVPHNNREYNRWNDHQHIVTLERQV